MRLAQIWASKHIVHNESEGLIGPKVPMRPSHWSEGPNETFGLRHIVPNESEGLIGPKVPMRSHWSEGPNETFGLRHIVPNETFGLRPSDLFGSFGPHVNKSCHTYE